MSRNDLSEEEIVRLWQTYTPGRMITRLRFCSAATLRRIPEEVWRSLWEWAFSQENDCLRDYIAWIVAWKPGTLSDTRIVAVLMETQDPGVLLGLITNASVIAEQCYLRLAALYPARAVRFAASYPVVADLRVRTGVPLVKPSSAAA